MLGWVKIAVYFIGMSTTQNYQIGENYARQLDERDELASFRHEFSFQDPQLIYLDGNSLGRLPNKTAAHLHRAVEEDWGKGLIRGWNQGWYEAPARIGDKIGSLLGAASGQALACDSTSTNLFKLAAAALPLRPGRKCILSDSFNFPSDLYILQGAARLLGQGHSVKLVDSTDGISMEPDALCSAINQDTALVVLSQVAFKSGYLYDVSAITRRAHQAGALVLWDLCHSAGVIPIELDAWGVDLAVGCTYKYLNGGPGAPAFLYVRHDLQEQMISPIQGWFGQKEPFAFALDYQPAAGITRFLGGTPPVLSLLAVEPALDLVQEAGVERLYQKAVELTSYLVYLADEILAPLGFALGSPRDPARRGAHISLRHPEGYRINRALIEEMKLLPDFREPDNIRLGLAPLYTSFGEIWEGVDRIRRVVTEQRYLHYSPRRLAVT